MLWGDSQSFFGLTSKIPPFGVNVKFDADVKITNARASPNVKTALFTWNIFWSQVLSLASWEGTHPSRVFAGEPSHGSLERPARVDDLLQHLPALVILEVAFLRLCDDPWSRCRFSTTSLKAFRNASCSGCLLTWSLKKGSVSEKYLILSGSKNVHGMGGVRKYACVRVCVVLTLWRRVVWNSLGPWVDLPQSRPVQGYNFYVSSHLSFLQHSDVCAIREEMYQKQTTNAEDFITIRTTLKWITCAHYQLGPDPGPPGSFGVGRTHEGWILHREIGDQDRVLTPWGSGPAEVKWGSPRVRLGMTHAHTSLWVWLGMTHAHTSLLVRWRFCSTFILCPNSALNWREQPWTLKVDSFKHSWYSRVTSRGAVTQLLGKSRKRHAQHSHTHTHTHTHTRNTGLGQISATSNFLLGYLRPHSRRPQTWNNIPVIALTRPNAGKHSCSQIRSSLSLLRHERPSQILLRTSPLVFDCQANKDLCSSSRGGIPDETLADVRKHFKLLQFNDLRSDSIFSLSWKFGKNASVTVWSSWTFVYMTLSPRHRTKFAWAFKTGNLHCTQHRDKCCFPSAGVLYDWTGCWASWLFPLLHFSSEMISSSPWGNIEQVFLFCAGNKNPVLEVLLKKWDAIPLSLEPMFCVSHLQSSQATGVCVCGGGGTRDHKPFTSLIPSRPQFDVALENWSLTLCTNCMLFKIMCLFFLQ